MTSHAPVPPPQSSDHHQHIHKSLNQQLFLGGLSGTVATIFTNPFDVIKVRLQIQRTIDGPARYPGFVRGTAVLIRNEGVGALYSGLSAGVLRAAVYSSTRLGLYEPVRDFLAETFHGDERQPTPRNFGSTRSLSSDHAVIPSTWLEKVGAGMCTGLLASFVGNPLELLKVRMQASKDAYPSILEAFRVIVRTEGLHALWNGLGPTIVRSVLLTSSQIASYDHIKQFVRTSLELSDGWKTHLIASFASGLISTTAINPADVIKTRMMNDRRVRVGGGGGMYSGAIDCLVKTIRHEGFSALMKGWLPNYYRLGPHTMIMFVTYETFCRLAGWKSL